MTYRDRRNEMLVRQTANVLWAYAHGHPTDGCMASLKRAFEQFKDDTDLGLVGVFERMEDR